MNVKHVATRGCDCNNFTRSTTDDDDDDMFMLVFVYPGWEYFTCGGFRGFRRFRGWKGSIGNSHSGDVVRWAHAFKN